MRKTKIVCTIGPASRDDAVLDELVRAGMDVARVNFSHGERSEQIETIERVRRAAGRSGRHVAVLQDLCGPKIRTGRMKGGSVELQPDASTLITTEEIEGTAGRFSSQWPELPRVVKPGGRILIDDGLLELAVESVKGNEVRCKVVRGGPLSDHKGMNLPGARIDAPALTEKDREDLRAGLAAGVDYVALSFVMRAEDVREARRICDGAGVDAGLIAKIERPEAVASIDEILDASDAIMIARGDLGVELAPELVPGIQKDLIEKANAADKPVITATQMLESMKEHARPTRAEVSDVANAVLDGTDAVMLSGETAVGAHPVLSCLTMSRIAEESEGRWFASRAKRLALPEKASCAPDAVALASQLICRETGAKLIVAATMSGTTARYVSMSRPEVPVLAFTPERRTAARCALYWGVTPIVTEEFNSLDRILHAAEEAASAESLAARGDNLLLIVGLPLRERANTNTLHLHRMGSGGTGL